eukprot:1147460-Pelagomonas_calceolata.AAC.1
MTIKIQQRRRKRVIPHRLLLAPTSLVPPCPLILLPVEVPSLPFGRGPIVVCTGDPALTAGGTRGEDAADVAA